AREVGLHRLNDTARGSCSQITLDRIGPGDYTELGSSAVMFFEINNRAKCRAVPELRQLHYPVRLRDRQSAIGCAKIKPDCFHQGCFLQPSPTPIGDSPAGVALVSVLVAPRVALSSVAFLVLAVHVVVARIGSLHAEGRGVAAWLFLRTANL